MKEIRLNATTQLRLLELHDAPDIYQAIDSQRDYLGEFLPFVNKTDSIEYTQAFVQSSVCASSKKGEYSFVINHEGNFAGIIGFKDLDKENQKVEIGYWLCRQYQHRGIMTSAVKALCKLAFEEMHINRIQIKCAVRNTPSKRIPMRLGFSLEGTERSGEKMADGTFADLEIYSLLQSEITNINKYTYE